MLVSCTMMGPMAGSLCILRFCISLWVVLTRISRTNSQREVVNVRAWYIYFLKLNQMIQAVHIVRHRVSHLEIVINLSWILQTLEISLQQIVIQSTAGALKLKTIYQRIHREFYWIYLWTVGHGSGLHDFYWQYSLACTLGTAIKHIRVLIKYQKLPDLTEELER